MKAEIITIGDELLIGQVVDTNSSFIATKLNEIGISVCQISSISDEGVHIITALKEAQSRAELVVITGGLGPTKDDVTKHSLCSYFNDSLVENLEVKTHIVELFKKNVNSPIQEVNLAQAMLPSKAEILHNEFGTAAGMWFSNSKGVVVSLPGVPYEMKALVENQLLPKLISRFKRPFIIHKTLVTYGMGETAIAEIVEDWENDLPEELKLAYLPSLGKVRLRLTGKGKDQALLTNLVENQFEALKKLVQFQVAYSGEDTDLEKEIARLLTHKKYTLAIAESFTGGALSALFTAMPGASQYFKGSVIAYASEIKETVLGVPKELIDTHSVVSDEVVQAMALGVRKKLSSHFAIATTGNAGPLKGDSDAEIGTVYIAVASPKGVISKKFQLGKSRERVVQKGIISALTLLFEELLNF